MDPRLLQYYNTELRHIRESGGEFAKQYPKIAARLGLDGFECADPYVERLLEGFAFLAARVQLKIDSEFPTFTRHLLEMLYPHYLAPTPSMAVAKFQPDHSEGSLSDGFELPRGGVLRGQLVKGVHTPCEFRTCHDMTLWPIQVKEAEYLPSPSLLPEINIPGTPKIRAGIRVRLETTADIKFDALSLDTLTLYLRGTDELPMHLYEQIMANCQAVAVRGGSNKKKSGWELIGTDNVKPKGFEEDEAILPYGLRSFDGYRLLHEYFAFPHRFMFADVVGLKPALSRCEDKEVDIVFLLDRSDASLEHEIKTAFFELHCTPVVNLFPKRADRIHLNGKDWQFHLVPERTRPMDFEVYSITSATGVGTSAQDEQEFLPFFSAMDPSFHVSPRSYYTIHRERRLVSSQRRNIGPRSSYIGSEVYLSLVDADQAPFRPDLKQLAVKTLCTNRDLPLLMPVGVGATDFSWETGAPIESVRCVSGPSKPRPSFIEGDTHWRLTSHLTLNYLSLVNEDERRGATALRDMLGLYTHLDETEIVKNIEGVQSVQAKPVFRRLPTSGPIAFGRGMEVVLTMDESAFEGSGCYLLGAVLERFFAKYVSINSFTETALKTTDRGEIARWPARAGNRHIL